MALVSFESKYYVRGTTHAAVSNARQRRSAYSVTREDAGSSCSEDGSSASASTAIAIPVSPKPSAASASACRDGVISVQKDEAESGSDDESEENVTASNTPKGHEKHTEVAARDWLEAFANLDEAMMRAGENKLASRTKEEDVSIDESEDEGCVTIVNGGEALGCSLESKACGAREKSEEYGNEVSLSAVVKLCTGHTGKEAQRANDTHAPNNMHDSKRYNPVFEDSDESHFWVRPFESGSALLCVDPRERSFVCGLSRWGATELEDILRDLYFWDPTWLLSGGIHEEQCEDVDSVCNLFSFDDVHIDTIPLCAREGSVPDVGIEKNVAHKEDREVNDIEIPYEFDTVVHASADGEKHEDEVKKDIDGDNVGNAEAAGDTLCDIECRVRVEKSKRARRKAERRSAARQATELLYRLRASVDDFGSAQNRFRFQGKDWHAIASIQYIIDQGIKSVEPTHTDLRQRIRGTRAQRGEHAGCVERLSTRHQDFLLELALLPAELKQELRKRLHKETHQRIRNNNTERVSGSNIDDLAPVASHSARLTRRGSRPGSLGEEPRVRSRRRSRSKAIFSRAKVEATESTARLSQTQIEAKETKVKESKEWLPYANAYAELIKIEGQIPTTVPAGGDAHGRTASPSAGSSIAPHAPRTATPLYLPCHFPPMQPIGLCAKETGREDDSSAPPSTTASSNTLLPSDAKASASPAPAAKRTKRETSTAHERSCSRATMTSHTNLAATEDDKVPDSRSSERDFLPKRFLATAPEVDTSLPAAIRERSLSHRIRRNIRSPSPNIRQKYARRRWSRSPSFRRGRASRSRSLHRRGRQRRRSPNGRRDYDSRRGFRR